MHAVLAAIFQLNLD